MVFSLAASHKIGIAAVAGCFILFALASALWLPRRRPDFPTRSGLGWYMGVVVTFAAGTLVAVVVLAAEPKEKAEAAKPGPSTPTAPGQTTGPTPPKGNPVAGRQLFVANACSSCHTFAPAKATGKIGPDLDKLVADAQKAGRGSEQQYAFESISSPDAYIAPGFPRGVMPNFGAKLSKAQITDLVAFLTQKS